MIATKAGLAQKTRVVMGSQRGEEMHEDRSRRTTAEASPSDTTDIVEITLSMPSTQGQALMRAIADSKAGGRNPVIIVAAPESILRGERKSTTVSTTSTTPSPAEMAVPTDVIRVREMTIIPGRHEVLVREKACPPLTHTEFGILSLLAKHAGWVFSREQIVDAVKGHDYPVTTRAVDVQIAGLRKKLGTAANYIQTVRGVGYRLRD